MSAPTFAPPCGPVLGWSDHDVIRATGIPYATSRRFEPPTATSDWQEPLAATSWSPACPQPPTPLLDAVLGNQLGHLPRDEHCQRLSVTLPNDVAPGDSLPVMVWIHGGSYTSGAGDMPITDPAALVAEQRVVVVSVTYRLGIFGFLGSGHDHPANLGLLDQLEALRWVQRNIAAFGGDPRQVTAFGESAGGDAVAHLMATTGAAALFSRAIIQSPPLGIARGRATMTAAMARAAEHVTAQLPADEVVALQPGVEQASSSFGIIAGMPFGTQYGFDPLPAEEEIDAAWDSVAPDIDVLIGYTAEEAKLFLPRAPTLQRWTRVPVLGTVISGVVIGYVTEAVYARGVRRFAKRHARAGGRALLYVVRWSAPGNPFGSAHTIDLPLLFGNEEAWQDTALVAGATWSEIDGHARQVRQVWADFARGELPDRGGVPGVLSYRRVREA
ncbi:MAG TPA: carboxylesterase family protein [Propionibacteriaceae bacterium]